MAKNIEEYGELTLAMKNFENAYTIYINKPTDPTIIRSYQKSKAKLGDLLVDLMIKGKLDFTVNSVGIPHIVENNEESGPRDEFGRLIK